MAVSGVGESVAGPLAEASCAPWRRQAGFDAPQGALWQLELSCLALLVFSHILSRSNSCTFSSYRSGTELPNMRPSSQPMQVHLLIACSVFHTADIHLRSTVNVFVRSPDTRSERRFDLSLTIGQLKVSSTLHRTCGDSDLLRVNVYRISLNSSQAYPFRIKRSLFRHLKMHPNRWGSSRTIASPWVTTESATGKC